MNRRSFFQRAAAAIAGIAVARKIEEINPQPARVLLSVAVIPEQTASLDAGRRGCGSSTDFGWQEIETPFGRATVKRHPLYDQTKLDAIERIADRIEHAYFFGTIKNG